MPSTYSPNLRIELIASGEQANTWGNTTNTNLGTLIEQAIAGLSSIDVTAGNVTLTAYNGASDQSRQMILNVTGTPGVARTLTAPSVSKVYVIANNSNADVTIETATGTGVTVSSGYSKFVFCDGTDFSDVTTETTVLAVEDLIVNGDATLGDALTDVITINGTVQPGVVISGSSSSAALRITQTGTGNALVVEDSANPDSTPFVINNEGAMLLGATVANSKLYDPQTTTPRAPYVQFVGANAAQAGQAIISWSSSTSAYYGPALYLAKSASNTINTQTVVTSGTTLGSVMFSGDDGTNFVGAAKISADVDGTPGTNDMPGRLVFSTTADGASSPTEKMRINNAGNVLVGRAFVSGGERLGIGGNTSSISTTTSAIGILNDTAVSSAQTNLYTGYNTFLSTSAASFTLAGLRHFSAFQSTIGAGSTVTNQYGFLVDASLTGATNNYGFYSNIASGTGRYNFYAAGTADNYFAGNVLIGLTGISNYSFVTAKDITGGTSSYGVSSIGTIQSDVTTLAQAFRSRPSTAAVAFTLGTLQHFAADQGTIGAGSTLTNQYGFFANSTLTGATNNYGFYSNIASGSGRYNFYAAGTADNYFAGAIGIGDTALTGYTIKVSRSITGATSAVGMQTLSTIQSDVTSSALIFGSKPSTAAAAFTLGTLYHFIAEQGTVGAGSAVTNQMGFSVQSSLTGATNDYGFYSAIASGSGRYNFYAAGTADNYFAGRVGIGNQNAAVNLYVEKNITGGAGASAVAGYGLIQSDVTTSATGFGSYIGTAAASFTLTNLTHFGANLWQIGAGSTVTNQFGFSASAALIGATNNYGFYSNIASGSGRYNFYAVGTADNYFAGNVKTEGTLAGGYSALSAGTTAMGLASDKVVKVTPNATATFTTTVAPAGATASIIIVTSGTTSYTITFGTGFLTTGTLATGTVTAKTFVVNFVSDGTTMIETSRTVAM